ncbi:ABC transporter substrate-binding protein [Microbacterium sp. PMB16]|uniref:ABC transporter substrate-binding protein n=1 Tax=Microbacterium sp. PMB16 TaxID=3120157 RepID=UPI003F4C6688
MAIKRNSLTVAALLAAAVLVSATACAPRERPDATGGDQELTVVTPEAKGSLDEVTWGLAKGEPLSLDSAFAADYSPNTIIANSCESLLRVTPEFGIEPNLATYEQADDTTLVFTLRDGVTFWNGDPLTADDVVFSMNRNSEVFGSYSSTYARVASIEATGPLEVTVKFSETDAAFLPAIAGLAGAIHQKSFVEAAGADYGTAAAGIMCTGPFAFDSWMSGESITLKANESYWNEDLKPKVKQIVFKFFSSDSSLTTALQSGGLDGSYEVPYASVAALQDAEGQLFFGPSTKYLHLRPLRADGAAGNEKIRQAIDISLDKAAFVEGALQGAGQPLETFTTPFMWASSPAKDVYDAAYAKFVDADEGPDVDEAKRLVKESGYDTSQPIVMVVLSGDAESLQLATQVQGTVTDLGLTAEIVQIPPAQVYEIFSNPDKRADKDFLVGAGFWEAPTPLYQIGVSVSATSPLNYIGYDDPAMQAELDQALSSLDPAESAEHFVAAQAMWQPHDLVINAAVANEVLYLNKGITGAPSSIAYLSLPWAAMLGSTD